MKRTRIRLGVYKTDYGYSVIYQKNGRGKEVPFPPDVTIPFLVAWRKQQVKLARSMPGATTPRRAFARDVVRYLRTRKGRTCYSSERSHLKPWITRFGKRSRFTITRELISLAVADWVTAGVSAKTIRHRMNVLRQVFKFCDGVDAPHPTDHVSTPTLPKRRPQGVPDGIIKTTATRLADQERAGRLRDGKTRARFLVLATCGKRPCQVMRAQPGHLDWAARVWHVEPAKHSHGGPLALNDEMFAAWRAFAEADAWGDYDPVSFAKTLRRNGWPEGVRPYRMRHQTLQTLSRAGVDFGAVQQAAGHASPETTRRHYVPHELATSQRASAALEGRFEASMFEETHRTRTGVRVGGTDYQGSPKDPTVVGAPVGTDPTPPPEGSEPPKTPKIPKDHYQDSWKAESEISGILRKSPPSPNGDTRGRLVKKPSK